MAQIAPASSAAPICTMSSRIARAINPPPRHCSQSAARICIAVNARLRSEYESICCRPRRAVVKIV